MIVGLGNPGKKYKDTKHNVGFMTVNKIAYSNSAKLIEGNGEYYYAEGKLLQNDFLLMIPTTFMNNSGIAVKELYDKYDFNLNDMMVVCDDINLPTGKIRLRSKGSDGGHNGLSSIIYQMQTNDFPRIRIGIGREFNKGQQADYVLSKFDSEDLDLIESAIDAASNICGHFIMGGIKEARDFYSKEYRMQKSNLPNNKEIN